MFAKLAEHSDLMRQMAGRTGVDLGQALIEGRVGAQEYRDRAIRCSICNRAEACRSFLKATHIERRDPPDYCVNSDIFKKLRIDRGEDGSPAQLSHTP